MCRAKPQKHLDIQDVDTSAVKGRAAPVQQVSDVLAGFTFVDQFAGLLDPLGLQFRVPAKLQPASLRRLDLEIISLRTKSARWLKAKTWHAALVVLQTWPSMERSARFQILMTGLMTAESAAQVVLQAVGPGNRTHVSP